MCHSQGQQPLDTQGGDPLQPFLRQRAPAVVAGAARCPQVGEKPPEAQAEPRCGVVYVAEVSRALRQPKVFSSLKLKKEGRLNR